MRTCHSLAVLAITNTVLSLPAIDKRQVGLCSSGTPQCCDVDVLGVADLDCANPPSVPTNLTQFNDVCASVGKIDMCCVLPILDQAILCTSPTPK